MKSVVFEGYVSVGVRAERDRPHPWNGPGELETGKLETGNWKTRNWKLENWKLDGWKLEARHSKAGNWKAEPFNLAWRSTGNVCS